MDLFGQNILDFPSDGHFLYDDLPQVSDSLHLADLDLGLGLSSLKEEIEAESLDLDLDSFLNSPVSFDQESQAEEVKNSEEVCSQGERRESLSYEEMMAERSSEDRQSDVFSQGPLLQARQDVFSESGPDLLDREDSFRIKTEISEGLDHREADREDIDSSFDDLLKSMFEVPGDRTQNTKDLISSILSSEDSLDPEFFEMFGLEDVGEEEEAETGAAVMLRDHDYTLPSFSVRTSHLLTPPQSPDQDQRPEILFTATPRGQLTEPEPARSPPVMTEVTVNPRSVLKKRTLEDVGIRAGHSVLKKTGYLKLNYLTSQSQHYGVSDQKYLLKPSLGQFDPQGVSKRKKPRKVESDREVHNSKERQRRTDMNVAFESLKDVIPTISSEVKASKLKILISAQDYCRGLKGKLERLEVINCQEQNRMRELREKLHMLEFESWPILQANSTSGRT